MSSARCPNTAQRQDRSGAAQLTENLIVANGLGDLQGSAGAVAGMIAPRRWRRLQIVSADERHTQRTDRAEAVTCQCSSVARREHAHDAAVERELPAVSANSSTAEHAFMFDVP